MKNPEVPALPTRAWHMRSRGEVHQVGQTGEIVPPLAESLPEKSTWVAADGSHGWLLLAVGKGSAGQAARSKSKISAPTTLDQLAKQRTVSDLQDVENA